MEPPCLFGESFVLEPPKLPVRFPCSSNISREQVNDFRQRNIRYVQRLIPSFPDRREKGALVRESLVAEFIGGEERTSQCFTLVGQSSRFPVIIGRYPKPT